LHVKWHQRTAWDAGYEDLLELVGLPPLEQRRIYLKLCLLFKITHGLCHFPTGTFTPGQILHNFRMNSLQLYQPLARTNAFYFYFILHTVSLWNRTKTSHFTLNRFLGHILSLNITSGHNVFVLVLL